MFTVLNGNLFRLFILTETVKEIGASYVSKFSFLGIIYTISPSQKKGLKKRSKNNYGIHFSNFCISTIYEK